MKITSLADLSLTLATATGSGPEQVPAGPNPMWQILFFGLMFAAMYFLLIAPQRKKQKEHEKMLKAITTGDEIITSGGIFGVISNVKEDRFVVKVSEGTKLEIGKGFVQSVVKKASE
jgi:preprotein translocase subunit YajC